MFTQEEGGVVVTRELPAAAVGDLVVLHDAGAYGAAQASNYNSRPHAAGAPRRRRPRARIRRRQRIDELLDLEEI